MIKFYTFIAALSLTLFKNIKHFINGKEFQSRHTTGMRRGDDCIKLEATLGFKIESDKSKKPAQASMTSAHFYTRLTPLLKNIKISNRIRKVQEDFGPGKKGKKITGECRGHKIHLII
jgi:hypothetical protein